MKILEHGNTAKSETRGEKFVCDECGCIFKAKDGEYYVDHGTWGYTDTITLNYSVTYSAYVTDTYACNCPECHKMVTKTKKEKRNIYSTYTTTDSNVLDINSSAVTLNNVSAENAQEKGE